ncbi:hypothetical protein SBRY_40161 [Actinacidiphila bryophytorum]|uniref:Uncharacterized protein n=1 Tax=Actinacidiphila bryophytorum TaxID=1436133 RepID=A0A9W4MHY3_9ACTN|nr:hypothetical protein SBRY_40161 [Actinacidiphila bryophytorum]
MVVGAASEGPVELALRLLDGEFVDGGVAVVHQAVGVELPVLVAVSTEPVARIVAVFVGEAHRDAVAVEGPQLLDEPVLQLLVPLAGEEGDDLVTAGGELRAVPPARVHGVGQGDLLRVAGVPAVFRQAGLLYGALPGERRERGACFVSHGASFGSVRYRRRRVWVPPTWVHRVRTYVLAGKNNSTGTKVLAQDRHPRPGSSPSVGLSRALAGGAALSRQAAVNGGSRRPGPHSQPPCAETWRLSPARCLSHLTRRLQDPNVVVIHRGRRLCDCRRLRIPAGLAGVATPAP